MTLKDKIIKASSFIKEKTNKKPTIAIILGSGLGKFADELQDSVSIDYHSTRLW